jgi:hypothetical protein
MSAGHVRFAVFGFDSTHDALRAESVLLAASEEVALIPTPKALGSLCGFAVRVPLERRVFALEAMRSAGCAPNAETEMGDRV